LWHRLHGGVRINNALNIADNFADSVDHFFPIRNDLDRVVELRVRFAAVVAVDIGEPVWDRVDLLLRVDL